MTLVDNFASKLRLAWFRAHGIEFGAGARLARGASLARGYRQGPGRVVVGAESEVGIGTCLHAWGGAIRVGARVFLGPYVVIYGHGGVDVGDDTLIAMHCRIVSSNHAIPPLGTPIRSQADELRPTRIGRDVWLGAGVTVLGGVTIGDGCIVGAGAVVTKNLPAGSICHGAPAAVRDWRPGAGPG